MILNYPFKREEIEKLNAGDIVYLNGMILTARDAAHQRLIVDKPEILKDSIIYYTGPTPAKDGMAIGSCGPTTSSRMDKYFEKMCQLGVLASIGKGERSNDVLELCKKYHCCYFIIQGGLGALTSLSVKEANLSMYPDLLAEAVYKLEVKDLKVMVSYDTKGNSIYKKSDY